MKKFSIRSLELAKNDVVSFAKMLKSEDSSSSGFGGSPKTVRWLHSVGVYHSKSDISEAINYLVSRFGNRKDTPKNRREVENLVLALQNYVKEYKKFGYEHREKAYSIEIMLSPKLKMTGWIWLINEKKKGGWSGYIVADVNDETDWQNELKYPIIQDYISDKMYECDSSIVNVGVIDYKTGKHYHKTYSKDEIDKAKEELNNIGKAITNIL